LHQRVVFQLELFWETERLNVMEFLLEDLCIDQYGYPLVRSLIAQWQLFPNPLIFRFNCKWVSCSYRRK